MDRPYGHVKTDLLIQQARDRYKKMGYFVEANAPLATSKVILSAEKTGKKINIVFITVLELLTEVSYQGISGTYIKFAEDGSLIYLEKYFKVIWGEEVFKLQLTDALEKSKAAKPKDRLKNNLSIFSN